jgi:alkaline phosphatase D
VKIQVLPYDEDRTSVGDGDIIKRYFLRLKRQLSRIRSAWDQDPGFLRTLLLGVPSRPYAVWSLITVLINLILILCTIDSVYHGPILYQSEELSFARIGFVSDTGASILIREPDTSQLPIYVSYRSIPNPAYASAEQTWKSVERVYWLSNETDFTYSIKINGLRPSSSYQYVTSNNHTGFFSTAPSPGLINPSLGKFTFLTSSCLKARFPYKPFSHPLSVSGFRHLAKWIPALCPSFMVFLGDFIYVDVPLRFGYDVENYRREYRSVYNSPDWPGVSESLPWIHVMDDHDIANDWDANTTEPYPTALDAWNLYHSSVNPPSARPSASYFTFVHGPASFFLLDTRRYRTPESPLPPDSPEKSMLGPEQLASFFAFLRHRDPPGVKWKIVISSVPFTRNWRFNYLDTWAGYLYERDRILTAMWDVGARGDGVGVVVLSGDRHEFAATAFPPPKEGQWPISATVHEFSTSPLSMSYLPTKTYQEVEGEDEVCMKYIPDGNSKFGAVEIEQMKNDQQSLLRFRLFVDGEEKWDHVILSPPAGGRTPRATDGLWGSKLGLQRGLWIR